MKISTGKNIAASGKALVATLAFILTLSYYKRGPLQHLFGCNGTRGVMLFLDHL